MARLFKPNKLEENITDEWVELRKQKNADTSLSIGLGFRSLLSCIEFNSPLFFLLLLYAHFLTREQHAKKASREIANR